MAGLNFKLPTPNQLLGTAITLVVLFFIVRVLPIPENIKTLFRV